MTALNLRYKPMMSIAECKLMALTLHSIRILCIQDLSFFISDSSNIDWNGMADRILEVLYDFYVGIAQTL
ncbi:hypothetical protein MFLAVUS_000422 [Mucor flavus]|uniref:Uncharacterized protein n=1 Tax=Mucor flavus TaxID=439312 RepID=A0ABP9YJQ1_9FUNG